MYICRDCRGYFTAPDMDDCGFAHAFGFTSTHVPVCPYCESPDIEEGELCPKCGTGHKLHEQNLCPTCRNDLHSRVCSFFDTLTEEEERQFDDWLDGESITNREGFIVHELV